MYQADRSLKRKFKGIYLVCLFMVGGVGISCSEMVGPVSADLYVSPTGNDNNPGTEKAPLQSLEGARIAVRELKQKKQGDILVYIRGGKYVLTETVVFRMEDSGSKQGKISYLAYPGESPVFTSEVPITGWEKVDPGFYPEDLPESSRSHLWVASLPGQLGSFKTMYDGEELLPRAKRGFDPTLAMDGLRFHGENQHKLAFPEGALKNWSNLQDVEISLVPRARWQHNILGLKEVDEENLIAYPSAMATYQMSKSPQRSPSVFVENVIDALDEPGEWVVNTESRKIYYWPSTGDPGSRIIVPLLREFIRLEGDIDYEGPVDTPITDLVFSGLSFTKGERYTLQPGDAGTHSDWGIYDKDNALLRLRGAERVVIENCRFFKSGENAIRLDLYCQHNVVRNNLISYMGRTGVVLCGYGPGKKYVNKYNEVINNYIHHVGLLHWNGLGILLSMTGENRVAHNLIHHTPFNAIAITGAKHWLLDDENEREAVPVRWQEIDTDDIFEPETLRPYLYTVKNVVEYNEIHHPMLELGDGNCIYLNTSGKNNIIRNNFVHHMVGEHKGYAIRTDDHVIETKIYNNIAEETTGGFLLKLRNQIFNNFSINMVQSDSNAPYVDFLIRKGPVNQGTIHRNICYTDKIRLPFVGARGNYPPDELFLQTDVDSNLYFSAATDAALSKEYAQYLEEHSDQQGKHSLYEDPMFYDLANRDFRLRPGSPAFSLGIKPIDASVIGLLKDFPFAEPDESIGRLFMKTGEGNTSVLSLQPGESGDLVLWARTVTGYLTQPDPASVQFESLDKKVAVVDRAGVVKAVSGGKTEVEAKVGKEEDLRVIRMEIWVEE